MNGLERDGIILFVGDGCPACERAKPIYHKFFSEQNESYVLINARNEIELSKVMNIRGIPTLLFFKDGEEIDRIVGVPEVDKLIEVYEKWVDKDDFLAFD